jgi:hypothetical protein
MTRPEVPPADAVFDEFVCYYNGDLWDEFQRQSLEEWSTDSAERLLEATGSRAHETAQLLRSLSDNRDHPLLEPLERASLADWTGEEELWPVFQELTRLIATKLESLSSQASTGPGI